MRVEVTNEDILTFLSIPEHLMSVFAKENISPAIRGFHRTEGLWCLQSDLGVLQPFPHKNPLDLITSCKNN